MPEELRVNRTIERGFVDTGRPGRTGLDALSDALGRVSSSIGTISDVAVREAKREEQEVADALSSPLITEEEIAEIEEGANFPLARFRAGNRRGELRVQQELAKIQDAVANAPDVITAREILRERQAAMLEGVEDAAVAAGIRERFAREANTLLGEASKRRIADRNREEQLNVDEDLRLSLENGGATGYVNTLIPHLTDEAVSAGDVSGFLDRAAGVLENHWLAGDDEDINDNVFADDTLAAIDAVLKDVPLDSEQRKKFTGLRQRIQTGEEAARRRLATAATEPAGAAYRAVFQEVEQFTRDNPGVPIPRSLRRRFIDSAHTTEKAQAAKDWLTENAVPEGVLHTDEWQKGFSQVKAMFNLQAQSVGAAKGSEVSGVDLLLNPSLLVHAENVYEEIGAQLPVDLEGKDLRIAQQKAVADAIQSAKEVQARQQNNNEERADLLAKQKLIEENAKKQGTTPQELARSRAATNRDMRKLMGEAVRVVAADWRVKNGYAEFDVDVPLE